MLHPPMRPRPELAESLLDLCTSRVWDYTAYRSRHGNVMLMGGVHKRCSQNVISIPYLLCRYNFNDLVVTTFYADDPFPFQIG